MAATLKRHWPAAAIALLALAFVAWRLVQVDWQPRQLAEIGTRFSEQDPSGSEGYDGQFVLYMAEDLRPDHVAAKLDAPAYRYQRILLPLLARALSLGNPDIVPIALIAVNLSVHVLATAAIAGFLNRRGYQPRYALLYGLWVGAFAGIGADLHEPLAYGLAAMGMVQFVDGRRSLALPLLGLGLLAKETTLPFTVAILAAGVFARERRQLLGPIGLLLGFAAWQFWLYLQFGELGIGSGGANATPFEWIPLLGFLRIAAVDLRVFLAFTLLFVPGVIGPSVWTSIRGARALIELPSDALAWSILLNGLIILFLPFSTFREPLGLLRVGTGLVLSILLFGGERRLKLGYGVFWLAYLALIA